MSRRLALVGCVVLASGVALGCSVIGDPGGTPDGLPHGGSGVFRLLSIEETGIVGSLPGRAMALRGVAIESAMRAGDHLFYTHQDLVDEEATPPDDHPEQEVYQPAFGPREIHRAALRDEGVGAFDAGPRILAASEPWEGAAVFDPWAIALPGGGALLYYAAEGGIGVARAPSLDGAFTREPGPVLGPDGGAAPRRPTVVVGPDDAFWMYFDAGDGIGVARSEDGLSFTRVDGLTVEGEDETDDSGELRLANPGAVRVETRAGRVLVRLYVESVRDDGTRLAYLLGSEDGLAFDRFPRPVMEQGDVRFPAPYLVDDRVTFLYANLPFVSRGFQTRAVTVAVAPAGESFAPPVDESM